MTEKPAPDKNPHSFEPRPERDTGMDLAQMIGIVSESRWLVIGLAIAVFALAMIYSFLRTPVYEADAILQVMQSSSPMSGLQQQFSQLSSAFQGNALPTETELQLLETRAVLVPVINKSGLAIEVGESGNTANVSVFNVPAELQGKRFEIVPLGGKRYRLLAPDGRRVLVGALGKPATGSVDTPSGKQIVNIEVASIHAGKGVHVPLVRIPTMIAVKNLLAHLKVGELGVNAGMIRVSLEGTAPRAITREVNEIVQANVSLNVKENSAQAASQLKFAESKLPDIRGRLDKAQAKLADFLSRHELLALSQDGKYLIQDVTSIEQQMSPLKAQLAVARSSLGNKNPRIKALQSQLVALQDQRKSLISNVKKLPSGEQTLVRLQEDVEIWKGLYAAMLNQIQTLKIAKAGSVGDVAVVDHAIVPTRPVLPNHRLDALVGLVIGLLAGIAAAFIRRALHQGVEDPETLEQNFGLPVIAVLQRSRLQQRLVRYKGSRAPGSTEGLLAALGDTDNTVEGLHSLRTSLRLTRGGATCRILCMASLGPNEGKSFVSSNVAYLMAKSGKRVLLVDADLRRGHLHRVFGWTRGNGFAEYLAGDAGIEQVVRHTDVEGLDVVTTGALPEDAGTLLADTDLDAKLAALAAGRDFIIIDVPPVMAVSDAFMIERHATMNLLLIKYGKHDLRQIRLALKRFARNEVRLDGAIFNDVSLGAKRYAYRKFGYEYQYQYKSRTEG